MTYLWARNSSQNTDSRSGSLFSPRKRRRVVKVEVVVPTLRSVLDKFPPGIGEDDDDNQAIQILVNPDIKKNKNLELTLDTVQNRIRGLRVYNVDLDPEIRDVTVDRRFMSQVLGREHPRNLSEYRLKNSSTYTTWMTSWAPGLFFSSRNKSEWPKTQRVFSRIDSGKWQYMGQYSMERAAPLTVEEWEKQENIVVSTWAHKISKAGYGTRCRAIVHLRHQLGRKPAKAEIDQALQGGNRYKNVTKEQMAHALRQGWLLLTVWKMKCVGYDVGFQRELVERSADWVLPPPKPAKNQGTPGMGSKRKHNESLNMIDSDDESTIEELIYLPKGTKTRPIVV
ncbi:uncharacterized protein EV420DRAFT_1765366 [Desarmillaria tabescens]|uniref:DUF6697 domain-containing protein n=1 Tax=Armillaria tabescens TaxID=1929756 RepID=A0AA39KBE3_ARMTA|nr:uncharacterized protein EV420DRAFT_1765366 [Desarmillaria tabescens]KAK0455713.1 hypothetical protein EV420DRAFT_1765366 [Desarmillaria tabescens]